jgi:DNA-directed RNA polymerase subunit RPC12/RpoP
MMNKLTCPACKRPVGSVAIQDGEIRCPHCEHVMFVYRQPGEQFTPGEFMKLLDGKRGHDAGNQAAAWFNGGRRMRMIKGGLFVAWLWPQLAAIFKGDSA